MSSRIVRGLFFSLTAVCLSVAFFTGCKSDLEKGRAAYRAKDYQAAVKYFTKAAKSSDYYEAREALFNLGVCYWQDDGIGKNDAESLKWFRIAADQRHKDAPYVLALRYALGDGVEASREKAMEWIRTGNERQNMTLGTGLDMDKLEAMLERWDEDTIREMKTECLEKAVEDMATEPRKDEIPMPILLLYGLFSLFGIYSLVALLRPRHRARRWPPRNQAIRESMTTMIILILLHVLLVPWGIIFLGFHANREGALTIAFLFYPLLEIVWFLIMLATLYAHDFRKSHRFKPVRDICMIYLVPCIIHFGLWIMLLIVVFPGAFE
jgi:hypothetical protein